MAKQRILGLKRRFEKNEQFHQEYASSSSIWNNSLLQIGGKVFFWREWHTKGIKHIQCLYHNILKSFEELKETYNLHNRDFWKFLQLRDCMSKAAPRGVELPTQSPISSKFILLSTMPHLVGKIYNHLISGFKPVVLPTVIQQA